MKFEIRKMKSEREARNSANGEQLMANSQRVKGLRNGKQTSKAK
jgi:hypothetical protein